jgi:DNA polymerase-3 subunit delta
VFDLAPEAPDFLVSRGAARHVLNLKDFLRAKAKGNFVFDEEESDSGGEAAPAGAAARLHQLLEKLVESPPPGCRLLLTASAARETELSSALLTRIKRHGTIEKFVTYDDFEPLDWVLKTAKQKGLPLNRAAAAQIIHLAGNDLGQLDQELEKLSLLFPPGSEPDQEALLQTLHGNSRYSLFWITEKVGAKDLDGALSVLEQFLMESPGEHPVLIGILARYLRQLYQIHALRALGASEAELASQLKLHPFIARKLAGQAERFSTAEIEQVLMALARLDVALKRSSHLTSSLFKEFVQSVCIGAFRNVDPPVAHR